MTEHRLDEIKEHLKDFKNNSADCHEAEIYRIDMREMIDYAESLLRRLDDVKSFMEGFRRGAEDRTTAFEKTVAGLQRQNVILKRTIAKEILDGDDDWGREYSLIISMQEECFSLREELESLKKC